MNWFGGTLVVVREDGVRVTFSDISFTEAQRLLDTRYGALSTERCKEAFYTPYTTSMVPAT